MTRDKLSMDSIKNITKTEFLKFFDLLKKGNPETAWNEFAYAVYQHKDFVSGLPVEPQVILDQWAKYARLCQKEKKAPQFIKAMDRWIKTKDYLVDYGAATGGSFLDKYKK